MAFYHGKRNARTDGADPATQREPLRQPLEANSPLFDEFDGQNGQSGQVKAELVDLCRSLRHACAAMEARLDRQGHTDAAPLNHRAKPHAEAHPSQAQSRQAQSQSAYQHSDFDDDDGLAPEPAAISMRDMTGFLLSREGEHFLNLMRRMIREEMAQSGFGLEKSEPASRAPRETMHPEVAQFGLRDILRRQDLRHQETGRQKTGRQVTGRQDTGHQDSGEQELRRQDSARHSSAPQNMTRRRAGL